MTSEQYNCTLDDKAQDHAIQFIFEDPASRQMNVDNIRQWICSQSNYLNARKDAIAIVRFLRASKYNLEKSKFKLNSFYKLRGNTPEWFEQRDPRLPELQALLDIGVFLPLRDRDPEGRLVVLIRAAAHNPRLHRQSDVFKLGMMALDLAIERDESVSVYGVVAIFDLGGVSYAHAREMTPAIIKKAVHSWQDCYPVRIKSLDFVYSPSYVNVVLNTFRMFMSDKLKQRVHVHGYNLESLHEVVPIEILPEEYGGSKGKLQDLIDYWKTEVTNAQEWFMEDEKYKCYPDPQVLD